MQGSITDTLGWFAGAFYVIVALSIVYLFFFRIVPMVISGIKDWTISAVLRVTLVLAALAILIGCVAVITADWIFSQVLDTLPKTRIAREIDRVSGSIISISAPGAYDASSASYNPFAQAAAAQAGQSVIPGTQQVAPAAPAEPARSLRPNALDLWMQDLQERFNETGKATDNRNVMSRRDIPQGVTCDVAALDTGYWPKRYEEWKLLCSIDNFTNSVTLNVNGTAARGLTGGGYYSTDNPYTIYGSGAWPEQSYLPLEESPVPTTTTTSGVQGGPAAVATPAPEPVGAQMHTVQQGESLALIAQRYQLPIRQLVDANVNKYPQLTKNPNVIVVGWVLAIPAQQ